MSKAMWGELDTKDNRMKDNLFNTLERLGLYEWADNVLAEALNKFGKPTELYVSPKQYEALMKQLKPDGK